MVGWAEALNSAHSSACAHAHNASHACAEVSEVTYSVWDGRETQKSVCVCLQTRFLQILVRTLCVLGVGMIMGDGVLTPAISVVSAIEGLGQIPGGGGNIERSKRPLQISTDSGCSLFGL